MKIKRIKALVIKEIFQIIRDPSSILIAFVFPVILLFIYGVGVSLDMDNLKLGVVLEDTNKETITFLNSLKNSKFFSLDIKRDKKEIEKKVFEGNLKGFVTIPFYFADFKKRGKKAPIYVVSDGSEPNTANFVQNYVLGAFYKYLTQNSISEGKKNLTIDVDQRFWFNEELNSRHFLIPGALAIIMTLIGTLLTSLVISREWERGSMESLMATPVSLKEIYLSKIISYFFLGIISMLLCTFLSIVFFKIPFRGSFLVLIFISSVFLLTALLFGLFISCITKNQFLSSQISIITAFLPAFMLSGFVFEISSMPVIIRFISYIIPARYMVSSMQTLFLTGNVWPLFFFNIAAMSLIIIFFFLLIFTKTSKRLQ